MANVSGSVYGLMILSPIIDDPAGHRWTLSQTLFDAEPESWGGISIEL